MKILDISIMGDVERQYLGVELKILIWWESRDTSQQQNLKKILGYAYTVIIKIQKCKHTKFQNNSNKKGLRKRNKNRAEGREEKNSKGSDSYNRSK